MRSVSRLWCRYLCIHSKGYQCKSRDNHLLLFPCVVTHISVDKQMHKGLKLPLLFSQDLSFHKIFPFTFSFLFRSLREDLVVSWRQEAREEEDDNQREDPEPSLQRVLHLQCTLREDPTDQSCYKCYGLRSYGSQWIDRTGYLGQQKWSHGSEALEWDVLEESTTSRTVAHPQRLQLATLPRDQLGSV